jgi:ribosomal protein S14
MLKWSFKNQNLFKFYVNSQIELKVKLSKILIIWFINQHRIKIINVKYFVINSFTKFIKLFIKRVLGFLSKQYVGSIGSQNRIKLVSYPILQAETKKFFNFIKNLNHFISIYNSEIVIEFYRIFLEFYWLIDTRILQTNILTKKNLEKQLYFNLRNNFPYYYNYLSNQNKLATYSKINIACFVTGRSRAVIRAFKLSRFKFREVINLGLLSGLSKSSW